MKIQIKHRYTEAVLFEAEAKSQLDCLLKAIKSGANLGNANLYGANLRDANLRGANLRSANLYGADLRSANLYGADLYGADLYGANLYGANLYGADLRSADLGGADLGGANLRSANLYGADLGGADLRNANLRSANLYGADLRSANLRSANLYGANLYGADLIKALSERSIVAAGDLIVFKKLQGGVVAKLCIPAEARRIGGLVGRKCRAEFAKVLEGKGFSKHDSAFEYAPGKIVRPDEFDDNPLVECSSGIHFFITREEAEAYE